MGAAYGFRCYSSPEAAADAMYVGVGPVLSAGSPSTRSQLENDAGVWYQRTYTDGTLTASSVAVLPSFMECDPADSAKDGIALGFLVLAAWAAVWCVRCLSAALFR